MAELSEYELPQFVQQSIRPCKLSSEQIDLICDIVRRVAKAEKKFPNFKPGTFGFMVPYINYIIKDDDLKLFSSLTTAFATAAGVGYFADSAVGQDKTTSAAIAVMAALFTLSRNFRNKGRIIPEVDFKILTLLKVNPDIELDYLHFLLAEKGVDIEKPDLANKLIEYQNFYTADGSKREIVIKEKNRYRTAGI